MKNLGTLFVILFFFTAKGQDFLGLQTSNYAGVLGAYSNPANIVDNRMKVDIALIGLNLNVDNNYVGIKNSALKHTGSYFKPKTLVFPAFNNTSNPNAPDYYKNNLKLINNGESKSVFASTRIVLPSFLITLNKKNAIAFNWSVRNYVNLDGVSQELVDLMYSEFTIQSLLNKKLSNKNLSFQQMAWAEYGFSYAHVLKDDGPHFFKVGASVKLLQGLAASYIYVKDLQYQFNTKDTLSFFNTSISYGHSDNLDFSKVKAANDITKLYKFTSSPSLGFDIGGVYEWRPEYDDYKYDMDGERGLWRRDKNKYKAKASFAINDIGRIKYTKGDLSNDFSADFGVRTFSNVSIFSNIRDINSLDSTFKQAPFVSKKSESTFTMLLPTAINAQFDYNIWKPFYVNVMANITNFNANKTIKIHEFTNISISPRFDSKWIGLTIPVSYNTLAARRGDYTMVGAMLRLGPLIVGSNDVFNYISKDVFGASMYFLLKIPIPYGHKKDTDKDGISDKYDVCLNTPGIWEFKGCPDKDGDHVPDKDDRCPDVPGKKELQGCPDKDDDGIIDSEDACPDSAGTVEFNGCPDRDGDKIIDRKDECPDEAGLAQFNGCPDKDADGVPDKLDVCPDVFGLKEFDGCPDKDGDSIPDKDDLCPDMYGPKQYKGCPDKDGDSVLDKDDLCPDVAGAVDNNGCPWPDTDKDGIIDKEDSCVTVPGELRYKGCPPPAPPMKAAEKRIIEKAFASLEFATGKDIIKPKSLPSLNDLAKLLIQHKDEWTLKLAGHTDNDGDAENNMLLSEKRSKAVKNYLVKKGAFEEKIIAEWFGQTMPIADNATAKGKQKNRRVEMKIVFTEIVEVEQPK